MKANLQSPTSRIHRNFDNIREIPGIHRVRSTSRRSAESEGASLKRIRPPNPSTASPRPGLVEFALIVPVMFFLLLIAVDFGRLFFTYIQITNASREAAAYAVGQPTDTATMATYAGRETNAQRQRGEGALAVTATCAKPGGTHDRVFGGGRWRGSG